MKLISVIKRHIFLSYIFIFFCIIFFSSLVFYISLNIFHAIWPLKDIEYIGHQTFIECSSEILFFAGLPYFIFLFTNKFSRSIKFLRENLYAIEIFIFNFIFVFLMGSGYDFDNLYLRSLFISLIFSILLQKKLHKIFLI